MNDKTFSERVPSLDQMNRTNTTLTQGGFLAKEKSVKPDTRSSFDEKGAARREHMDEADPGQPVDG
mgnify:CR=1 FL=1